MTTKIYTFKVNHKAGWKIFRFATFNWYEIIELKYGIWTHLVIWTQFHFMNALGGFKQKICININMHSIILLLICQTRVNINKNYDTKIIGHFVFQKMNAHIFFDFIECTSNFQNSKIVQVNDYISSRLYPGFVYIPTVKLWKTQLRILMRTAFIVFEYLNILLNLWNTQLPICISQTFVNASNVCIFWNTLRILYKKYVTSFWL